MKEPTSEGVALVAALGLGVLTSCGVSSRE
jgi:hypothetical protein